MIYNILDLQSYLLEHHFSQIFLLVDENTEKYCMPILLEKIDEITDRQATLLEIPSGEQNKSINTALNIINSLEESFADRESVIISLGGGMVTDLGGFVASIYKRGVQAVNVPTTLLAMVDAAIGGKNGVNYKGIKNLIGCFNPNVLTFLDVDFLSTLSKENMLSGLSEMLKTFLIADSLSLSKVLNIKDFASIDSSLIMRAAQIKEEIAKKDFLDKGYRRVLNFGHTIGHVIEAIQNGKLLHGYAVAIGMYYALLLSEDIVGLKHDEVKEVYDFLSRNYTIPHLKDKDVDLLWEKIMQDKKTTNNKPHFVLLQSISTPIIKEVSKEDLSNTINKF